MQHSRNRLDAVAGGNMGSDDYQRSGQTDQNALLLTGDASVDEEHYELIMQLNSLLDNPEARPGTEHFSEKLSQLVGQINAHINDEEQFFMSLSMPADVTRRHIEAHTEIIDQYTRLNLDLMHGKKLDRYDVLRMIKGWVIEHAALYDIGIKPYVRSSTLPSPERVRHR